MNHDTICALATANGIGAIGIIRVSGEKSFEIVNKIFEGKNLEKADENLRYAKLGFMEGVIPTSNVLEAQTAWLSAQSDKIDAQIDVKLTEVYLRKSMGVLK